MTKKLTSQDQELWASFTKDVHRTKCDKVIPEESKFVKASEKLQLPMPHVKVTQKVAVLHANELRNIRTEGRIDLHGFTQVLGEQALRDFLKNSVYKDWRWVIVITGKGSPDNPSILREQVPKWLQSMPELVTGYAFAAPNDGGAGAFYVKIRRKIRYK
ncbi:MAG: Smr/MutS family protein [Proteobacteria bacterium]|nr:Smr/MutS family protein [Pseudomonadota bacterium]